MQACTAPINQFHFRESSRWSAAETDKMNKARNRTAGGRAGRWRAGGRGGGGWRWRRGQHDGGAQPGVGGEDAVEAGEVASAGRHQGHQPLHHRLRRQGEGRAKRRTVVTTPEAEADALFIDSWWQVNRPAAPGLFLAELADVFSLLADMAGVGQRWPHPEVPRWRRGERLRLPTCWHGAAGDWLLRECRWRSALVRAWTPGR
jgi:hypothetical protein